MKIATLASRILLGLMFTITGANGFLHFIAMPLKPAIAMQFIELLDSTYYMVPVFALQIICGVLFLANRFVPLALTLIGPVLVNIWMFHLLMDISGTLPGAVATVLWIVLFYKHRAAFAGIFRKRMRNT